eukprot:1354019-Prymnesium_polylepis.1
MAMRKTLWQPAAALTLSSPTSRPLTYPWLDDIIAAIMSRSLFRVPRAIMPLALPRDDLSRLRPDEAAGLYVPASSSDTSTCSGCRPGQVAVGAFHLARSLCDRGPPPQWHRVCHVLRQAWAANATVRHHAHSNDPTRSEEFHVARATNSNAGDLVVPIAARLAF